MSLRFAATRRLGAFSYDASFSAANEIVVLFGQSGAGKSLTLQFIAGENRTLRNDVDNRDVEGATQLVRGAGLWGEELMAAVDEYPYSAGVGMNGECLPDDRNTLTLSDELAEDGMPRAEISFSQGENERAIDRHGVAVMERILRAAGARSTRVTQRSAHTLGTARMSDDPDDGVVDASGRSHEVDNLWICDNSTFPSALTANPALTQMALSLRTADLMLAAR